ncbi:erythromycin esterase family protein [Streptomyces sp. NPDC053427]|uniref:erythromycin esterase family protein n=1 Tax=Streptomyces sp. NPDC053427 TaxID=3365701 RepID=UPI0037CEE04F
MKTTVSQEIPRWIGRHAHPLTTLDPAAPLTDLLPLRDAVGEARVVAIGSATRQAHELAALSHRLLRLLVERLGFRSVALEGDDAERLGLGTYIRTGEGDPRALLAGARSFWRLEETAEAVRWIRAYNRAHPQDPVRFVPAPSHSPQDRPAMERGMADEVIRWHRRTGDRTVYWGGLAHTAVGGARTTYPTNPPVAHRNVGGHLREHFGPALVSVALTFHHGRAPYPVPAPPPDFADAVLGSAGPAAYLLDLRTEGPDAVRDWLGSPTARTRVIGPAFDPADNAAFRLSGGSLAEWFDVVGHVREVTPVRFLAPDRPAPERESRTLQA